MRLKTRHWFLLSLVLFGAAAWFWQLGNQRVARRQSAPATNAASATNTTAGQPFKLQVTNYAGGAPFAVAPLLATVTSNAPNAKRTNALAYRLSNTKMPLAELARSDRALLLRNVLLNTANPARPEIPEHLRAQGDPGAWIVQSRGAITASFREWLIGAGAEIVSYVPNNAFLVRADSAAMGNIRGSPWVAAVEPLEPYYKFDSLLLPLAVERQFSPHEFLNVVSFPREAAAAQAQLERLGAQVVDAPQTTLFGEVLKVKAPANALAAIAQIREVQLISVHVEKRIANDLSRVKIRVSTNPPITRPIESHYGAPTAADHLTGNNLLVGVNDTGVDDAHPDLTGRLDPGSFAPDPDGHGTHVIATFIGSGAASPLAPTNAMGSTNLAIFSGIAPRATAYVQDFRGPDFKLQTNTGIRRILVSNNSWGYPVNDYDIFAAMYDAGVRDSSPGETGEQEVAYVFAAGNDGGGDSQGLNGIAGSVLSPATAKNVISVGASDLPRFITNFVYRSPCFDVTNITATSTSVVTVCQTNQPWLPMTDSDNQIAPFSSRGNVGIGVEGPYGRFKPDVIAPGGMVVSARKDGYEEQSNSLSTAVYRFNSVPAPFNVTNLFSLNIPGNAVNVTILALTNLSSPPNLELLIGADIDAVPTTALGTNIATLGAPPLRAGTLFYTVVNAFNSNTVVFDLVVILTVTNDVGNYYEALTELNKPLKPYYRYESGTSMAAPQISGLLALFQEFLGSNVSAALPAGRPSPALLKALVINGARSLSPSYNLDTHAVVNHQGWGIANLSNSIPSGLDPAGTTGPMRFFDQSITNALITGASNTYQITVPTQARSYPLRVTLVWTDPPGNPLAGVKLVNDLNLTVDSASSGTNATNALLYLGNNFPPGSDFIEPVILTNGVATTNEIQIVADARDYVNNVENVYIRPPLAATYNVVVKGHRVNVNSLNSHSNAIGQDYALVISSGNVAPSNNVNLAVTGPVAFGSDNSNRIAALVRATNASTAGLFNQRVGANSALIISTNGTTNQWCFFLYTNSLNTVVKTGQYVAIFTFNSPELSLPRVREADIDLYVGRSSGPGTAGNLLVLDPNEVALSTKSTGRAGTELVLFTDAQPDEVFYIGVKSEDQQAAQFNIFAASSDTPFSSDDSNNIVASFFSVPAPIPDGSPDAPGGTNLFAIVMKDVLVQRVYATNIIYHEEAGDLIGILHHTDGSDGSEAAVTLNNHRTWTGLDVSVYDDSDEGDLAYAIPPDGPGTLRSFVGQHSFGLWQYDISDNALFHTGEVQQLTLVISPASTTNLAVDLIRNLPPGKWIYAAFPVPVDATNIHACVSYQNGGTGPLELYLRRGDFPNRVTFDKGLTSISPPGGCLDLGMNDNPPISPGRYYAGVYNAGPDDVLVHLTVDVQRGLNPNGAITVASPTNIFFIDDATTNSTLFVTNRGLVANVEVDVRIDHPRVADLALHLVSPDGVRTLLAENRGRDTTAGYGWTVTNIAVTNFGARVLDDGFENSRGTWFPTPTPYQPGAIISGWRVDSRDIDIVHRGYGMALTTDPHTGTNAIDLNGDNGPGGLWTNVSTTIGKTYFVSFAYCRNPGTPGGQVARIEVNSNAVWNFSYNLANTYTDLQWATTGLVFQATGTVTRIGFRQVNPAFGNGGMFIDTVRMDEVEIITNSHLYATFTDDPVKAIWPIKFAPPPFGSTNFKGTNLFISGFEGAPAGIYLSNSLVDGWRVLTNSVQVSNNNIFAYSDTNFLLLRTGSVARTLPTVVGAEYILQFATRADLRPVQIFNTGVSNNGALLTNYGLDTHYTAPFSDFANAPGPNVYAIPQFEQPPQWVGPDGLSQWVSVLVKPNINGPNGKVTYRTTFDIDGIPLRGSRIVGRWVVDNEAGIYLNGVYTGNTNNSYSAWSNLVITSGFKRGSNYLDMRTTNELGYNGLRMEFTETPIIGSANGRVRLVGAATNDFIAFYDGWRMEKITFVARSTNTVLQFDSLTPGLWLDHVQIRETGRKYYLPEEPLTPFIGQRAFGEWRLELWDSRIGANVSTANLVSWRLNLTLVRTNPPFVLLTNTAPFKTAIGTNTVRYFAFDVTCDNGNVTNILQSLGPPSRLDLIFNPSTFPLTGALGDYSLLNNVLYDTNILSVGSYPLLSSGRYYLAVRNTNVVAVPFEVTVGMNTNCTTFFLVPDVAISKLVTFGPGGATFSWSASPGSTFSVLYAEDPAGPWIELPDIISSATGAFSFTDDGTSTGGLPASRFYRIRQR